MEQSMQGRTGHERRRSQDVDRYVGERIRERRVTLGLSQQEVAGLLGITYQQEYKYERGANRVSASRLYQLATVLEVPIEYFFQGFSIESKPVQEKPQQRMLLDLVRMFRSISDEHHREAIFAFVRAVSSADSRSQVKKNSEGANAWCPPLAAEHQAAVGL